MVHEQVRRCLAAPANLRLRAEIPYVAWPPWGDRQNEKYYDVYSSRADLMRRAYRATHTFIAMVWDGQRRLRPVGGQWVRVEA
jgi:hypothetical protein